MVYYKEAQKRAWKKYTHTEKGRITIKKSCKKYRKTERGRKLRSKYELERYRRIRNKLFIILGNKCNNPFNLLHPEWCNDIRCLQIDHVNGNGGEERRKRTSGATYLNYILRRVISGSKEYQLLCANCNWIKRTISKEL